MKIIYIILLLFTGSILTSCSDSKVFKRYKITDFDNEVTDTLFPKQEGNYTTKYIKLEGRINDSLYISFDNGYKIFFSEDIDTTIRADYYGNLPALFKLNSYRASKGELEVEFGIE